MNNDSNLSILLSAKNNASAVIKQAQDDVKRMASETEAATGRTGDRFAAVGGMIKGALVGVSIAAVAAGGASINMAADFEQSLNILGSVSSATADQMSQLSQKARELGQDAALPGVSAADAANAMTELAKAGLDVNNVLGASKGVLSLAKAGQVDAAFAANVTAQALNAFSLEGKEANRVADLLAGGANASTASVEGMALGLSQVGAGAKSMGVNIQDTVTALSLFSNAGIQGSDAGTSLKAMFQQLANPTKESSELMKKLGLDFFDAKGNFIGIAETADSLQDKLGKLTTEQRNQALATIFGSDASRVAGVLASQGAEGFNELATAVTKQGAATELAKAQNSGFNGALDNFKSTLETMGTDLGTKVLPPLTDFLTVLTQNLPGALEWVTNNGQTLIYVLGGLAAGFAAIRLAGMISDFAKATKTLELFVGPKNAAGLKALGNGFSTVASGAKNALVWMAKHTAELAKQAGLWVANTAKMVAHGVAIAAVRTATALWTAAQWALNAALNANPISLIIIAIVALIAAIVLLWNNSETFRNIVTGVFEAVWNAIKAVWDWISNNWPLLLAILTGPIGLAVLWIINNWETVKAAFALAWEFIKGVWSNVVAWFGNVWNGIKSIFASVGQWFANMFTGAVNAIFNAWNGITGFFRGIWNAITSIFGSIGAAVSNGIVGAVRGVVNGILSGAENIVNGFVGAINGVIGTINKIPGVNIGRIGNLHLPRLAEGGIVSATPGGILANIGEGGKDEAVAPLDKLYGMIARAVNESGGGGSGITVEAGGSLFTINYTGDPDKFTPAQAANMAKEIMRQLRAQGLKIDEMGALR